MERRAAIIEAINSNRTYADIGKEYSISRQRVQQIALQAGIRRRLSVVREKERPTTWIERLRYFFRG